MSPIFWLRRQLTDHYVSAARQLGYRSRSAFKLLELNARFNLLRPGQHVIELGAAPGGWSQVVTALIKANRSFGGRVVAVDKKEWPLVPGSICLVCDFLSENIRDLETFLNGTKVDVILSDMSPDTNGHRQSDYYHVMVLAEAAYSFALSELSPGGDFVTKIFRSGKSKCALFTDMCQHFNTVHYVKPSASRRESPEIYLVAKCYQNNLKRGKKN